MIPLIRRDDLGWAILLNFLIYVALPVPIRFVGVLLGCVSLLAHTITTIVLPQGEVMFVQQVECPQHVYLIHITKITLFFTIARGQRNYVNYVGPYWLDAFHTDRTQAFASVQRGEKEFGGENGD